MLIAIFFNQWSLEEQQAILWWHIYDLSGFEERSFQVYHRKIWICNVGEISRRRKRNILITRLEADESQICNLFTVKVKNLRYSMMLLFNHSLFSSSEMIYIPGKVETTSVHTSVHTQHSCSKKKKRKISLQINILFTNIRESRNKIQDFTPYRSIVGYTYFQFICSTYWNIEELHVLYLPEVIA